MIKKYKIYDILNNKIIAKKWLKKPKKNDFIICKLAKNDFWIYENKINYRKYNEIIYKIYEIKNNIIYVSQSDYFKMSLKEEIND